MNVFVHETVSYNGHILMGSSLPEKCSTCMGVTENSGVRTAFSQDPIHRQDFYEAYDGDQFLRSDYSVYDQHTVRLTSISANCQLYLSMGCAFVAKDQG